MVFDHLPIEEYVAGLIEMNRTQSEEFSSPGAQMFRDQYRANHPTGIVVLQCMDGRVHFPNVTKVPLGIMHAYKTVGGKFDIGWTYFSHVIQDCVEFYCDRGQGCIILITYHYSKGDPHRGCAGCDYDFEKSVRQAEELKKQFEAVYGPGGPVVYPLVCGLETDCDSLILHGENGEKLDINSIELMDEEEARYVLRKMFISMSKQMLNDLLPLLLGNMEHVIEVRESQRPIIEMQHRERILAFGRGLDWLYEPNMALIVGPYDYDLETPIRLAAGIIGKNMRKGRVPDDRFLLMSSSHYSSAAGPNYTRAMQRAKTAGLFAEATIRKHHPKLAEKMWSIRTVTDLDTRRLLILPAE